MFLQEKPNNKYNCNTHVIITNKLEQNQLICGRELQWTETKQRKNKTKDCNLCSMLLLLLNAKCYKHNQIFKHKSKYSFSFSLCVSVSLLLCLYFCHSYSLPLLQSINVYNYSPKLSTKSVHDKMQLKIIDGISDPIERKSFKMN